VRRWNLSHPWGRHRRRLRPTAKPSTIACGSTALSVTNPLWTLKTN
jgi:hypothetical protein